MAKCFFFGLFSKYKRLIFVTFLSFCFAVFIKNQFLKETLFTRGANVFKRDSSITQSLSVQKDTARITGDQEDADVTSVEKVILQR